jgi:hypothetical protein
VCHEIRFDEPRRRLSQPSKVRTATLRRIAAEGGA